MTRYRGFEINVQRKEPFKVTAVKVGAPNIRFDVVPKGARSPEYALLACMDEIQGLIDAVRDKEDGILLSCVH